MEVQAINEFLGENDALEGISVYYSKISSIKKHVTSFSV